MESWSKGAVDDIKIKFSCLKRFQQNLSQWVRDFYDYIFVRCSNRDVYSAEFKDTNVAEAYEQIVETLKIHFPSPPEKNDGFIIAKRLQQAQPDSLQRKKRSLGNQESTRILLNKKTAPIPHFLLIFPSASIIKGDSGKSVFVKSTMVLMARF